MHVLFIYMAPLTLERTCGFTKQMPPTLRSHLYTPCRGEVLPGRAHFSLQALQQRGDGCSSGIRTGCRSDAAPKSAPEHNTKHLKGSGAPSVCEGLGQQTVHLWMHFCSKSQESNSDKGTLPIEGHSQRGPLGDRVDNRCSTNIC